MHKKVEKERRKMVTAEQERKVEEGLDLLLVKRSKRYEYLKTAILLAMDGEKMNLIHDIYPKIAQKYGIKKESISERIIITLEDAYFKNEKAFEDFFGESKYLSPAEFIKAFIKKINAE